MGIKSICDRQRCTGCSACMQVCPKSAISMEKDQEGFIYPVISEERCVECKKCIRFCPSNNIIPGSVGTFYMGRHKEKAVLKNSSSGGMFTALADYVLGRNGVVFGAVRNNEDGEVYHTFIQHNCDLAPMRLSKYYQSNINDSYQIANRFLKEGRLVLFTGTACQIAGLYSVMDIKYREFLITVDVLCHGVASKLVVDEYIKSKEKKFKKKIKAVEFRVKTQDVGWASGGGYKNEADF